MTTPTNKAAWLRSAKSHPFVVDDAPMPILSSSEIMLKTHAVAINPADWAIQTRGMLIQDFPTVLGFDVAGEVVELGSAVTKFKVGDRVVAGLGVMANRLAKGSFQLYVACEENATAILPDSIGFAEGCVLPLGLATAAAGLYATGCLELALPSFGAAPKGEVLLIWGGSTSVGSCAIQLAKGAGYEVAATCSAHNLEYCRGLGADLVFDYKKEGVIEEIERALKGKVSAGAYVMVQSNDVVAACGRVVQGLKGSKVVATVLPGVGPMVVPEGVLPEGVTPGYADSGRFRTGQLGPKVWEWVMPALADGRMKCKPDPEIVGHGLEACQLAVDKIGQGVSATKLVVKLI